MARQIKKIQDARKEELVALGYLPNSDGGSYMGGVSLPNVSIENIADFTAKQWTEQIEFIKTEKGKEQPAIEGEHIPPQETGKSIELPLRNADTDIAKIDFNKVKIAEYSTQFMGLSINSLNDKEIIKAVKAAKGVMRTARTSLEKKRKELKDWYISEGKKIDNYAKECGDLIEPIEAHLDAEILKFDQWFEAEEKRKEEEANRELNRRVQALKDAGITFNDTLYCIGEHISMDVVSIKTMSESDFYALEQKVKMEKKRLDDIAEKERIEKVRIENERKEKEAELLRQQNELNEKNRQLDEERENMRIKVIALRERQLKAAGLVCVGVIPGLSVPGYLFKNPFADISMTMDFIKNSQDADFDKVLEEHTATIDNAKIDNAQREEKNKMIEERLGQRCKALVGLGMIQGPSYFYFSTKNIEQKATIDIPEIKAMEDDPWADQFSKLEKLIVKISEDQQAFEEQVKKDEQDRQKRLEAQNALYMQRSSQLINLGLTIVAADFVRRNEWGKTAAISIEKVKILDEDVWPRILSEIEADVKAVNDDTEQKRAEALQELELLKSDQQKAVEYLEKVMAIPVPKITNTTVGEAFLKFANIFAAAMTEFAEIAEV